MPADPILIKVRQIAIAENAIHKVIALGRRMTQTEQELCEALAALAYALKQEMIYG